MVEILVHMKFLYKQRAVTKYNNISINHVHMCSCSFCTTPILCDIIPVLDRSTHNTIFSTFTRTPSVNCTDAV